MTSRSAEIILELEEILRANTLLTKVVSSEQVTPLPQDTEQAAAYILYTNVVPELTRNTDGIDGYTQHNFFTVVINSDCTMDKLFINDVVDSVQRSILNDGAIWQKLVDRDIISIEYDNAEFYPKRSAILAVEVVTRLSCT